MSLNNKMLIFMQILFVLCFFLIDNVKTDLPVHCLLKDVHGKWSFTINERTFTPDLDSEHEVSCGHGLPNKIVSAFQAKEEITFPSAKKIVLDLRADFKVYKDEIKVGSWSLVYDQSLLIQYGSAVLTAPFKYYKHANNSEADSDCSKTFLGWYIPDYSDNKKNWACFFGEKISAAGSNVKANANTVVDHSGKNAKTFGFLEVEGSSAEERQENLGNFLETNISNELKKAEAETELKDEKQENGYGYGFSFIQTEITNRELIENHMKYEQMGKVVQKLNKLNLGWEAEIDPKFIGMSFMQVKHQLGLNKGKYNNHLNKKSKDKLSLFQIFTETDSKTTTADKEKEAEQTVKDYLSAIEKEFEEVESNDTASEKSDFKLNAKLKTKNKGKGSVNTKEKTKASCVPPPKFTKGKAKIAKKAKATIKLQKEISYEEITKYINTPIDEIDENKLEKNWDWRNVGGKNFVPPVRNQGHCGSCYTFSTLTSLESRLRIQTNLKDQTIFSKQFPLSCNFYAEGCDGGYPVLVAKFSKEFELIPEECFAYAEKTVSCSSVCNYKLYEKKYTVKEFGYLGGAYGKTSEAQMMKEIRARGPIPGNILVHWSFQYYKGGIFSQQGLKKNAGHINLKDLFDYGMSWAKVEHSITLVGYGEDNGVKYWIGMNTWGETWGEKGFFKILRGENEAMVESMGDFMNVQVENR